MDALNFSSIFAASPNLYLLLAADDCYTILTANDAYLAATLTTREQLVGRAIFDAFPDNPADPAATGVRNLRASLDQVVARREPHTMAVQKYDIRGADGSFEPRYWHLTNAPVSGPDGKVAYVIHSVEDVTELLRLQALEGERERLSAERWQDVRARERLDREVENERARLRTIIEQSPAFICTLQGHDHVFEIANERYYEMVGRRDIIGKSVRDALPEIEGQGFFELLDSVFRTGKTFTGNEMPVLLRRSGGDALDRRFINIVYQALRETDGSISGVFAHGFDVTDLVTAREALRASEAQRRLALESAELGSWHVDPTTMALTTDARFRAIFGITADHIDYEEAVAVIHPEDQGHVRDAVAAAIRSEDPAPYSVEYRVLRSKGSIRWVFAKGRANVVGDDANKRTVSFDGTLADITDRKQAEDALHDSELSFRNLADAMPQMVWVTRPDGFHEYYNQRWYEFTGVPHGSTDGEGWNGMFHLDDQARTWAAWRHSLATGEPYEVEYRLRHHSGEYRWTLGRALPIRDGNGQIAKWFGTCTDIDGIKRLQQEREHLLDSERKAREEAERTGQMKDEFLATLSHELRTPLSAILGWSQILRRGNTRPETLAEGLSTIERNARAQTQIIEDLLDMSRIISGKISLRTEKIDLSSIVRASIETVRAAAAAKGIDIAFDVAPEFRCPVLADRNRMQQVFWNLLSNATKFTPRGGVVRVGIEQRHSLWQVDVSDSGEGIDPDFLPHVFEKFRQQDGSTTRRHGGLGLGLSIVKQLAELHGGTVRVSSDGLGKGATFTVSLPVSVLHTGATAPFGGHNADASMNGDAAESLSVRDSVAWDGALCEDLAGMKILVVDDEPDARALLQQLLSSCNATVIVAGSAEEAIVAIERDRPDVLVSDIGMPGEDGYALLKRVRQLGRARGGAIPAIALTAYARAEDRVKAVRAGFQMHVPKPVEPAELITMLASLANRDSA